MSLSAKDRSQDHEASHTNHPSSHDMLESDENSGVSQEQTTSQDDDSLVEHILDFLDKYPARFAPRAPLHGCMRAC